MSAGLSFNQEAQATPLMRQYFQVKAEYPDAILFFHLGDFFEMFYDDAIVASKLLDLTLTSRNKNQENSVPLCGVPVHTVDGYIARLVQAGKKVVVCEQVEDPKLAKGLVKRAVTRVHTPGTVMEEASLAARCSHFLMSVLRENSQWHFAMCEVSTGILKYGCSASELALRDVMASHTVSEVVYPESLRNDEPLQNLLSGHDGLYHHALTGLWFAPDYAAEQIVQHFAVISADAIGLTAVSDVAVLGGVLGALAEAKLLKKGLLAHPLPMRQGGALILDESTLAHLEIFETLRERSREGSLLAHLDCCMTAMGSRLLADWLRLPLCDVEAIAARQDAIEEFFECEGPREEFRSVLSDLCDLERLANRFIAQNPGPREMALLARGLSVVPELRLRLGMMKSPLVTRLRNRLKNFPELVAEIQRILVEDPPLSYKEGGFVRVGVHAELDELRLLERDAKKLLAQMETREKERTGIATLKVRFNSVFGYYIEITHSHRDKVPADYIRKQTLTNAERYITEELKIFEQKILSAGERMRALEMQILGELRARIQGEAAQIRAVAGTLAELDVFSSLATLARQHRYVRPVMQAASVLNLRGARHPVLETVQAGENFITNDVELDPTHVSQLIITGPNMAGKSTLMRLTALITLMAHIGSFVPCDAATIGLTDRIFTRVGAHDHLQKGLSTFMVEMIETGRILREATPRSLILLDEIGRGTSTFDGLSIAWAVAEDLHDRLAARTLFATHYHELCDLAQQKTGIRNMHMAVKEWQGGVVFLRKLTPGGTNRSYGVVVAGMAGLPPTVVKRAKQIMRLLEEKDLSFQSELTEKTLAQMPLFSGPARENLVASDPEPAWMQEFRDLDVNVLTPLEALNRLAKWKNNPASEDS